MKKIITSALAILLLSGCTSANSLKCNNCGKTYKDTANITSIKKHGMCESCNALFEKANSIKNSAIGNAINSVQ